MSHGRTSITLGEMRARRLLELLESPAGQRILTLDDLYQVAGAAGCRRGSVDQGLDVLIATGRLEQDEYGRPVVVRRRSA